MSHLATRLPIRRIELVIKPLGKGDRYVVKDPRRVEYFELGEEEHFLLMQLDGRRSAEDICAGFEERFGQSLYEEELEEFLALARERGFVQTDEDSGDLRSLIADSSSRNPQASGPKLAKQSVLYCRKRIFDPDRLFNWLEPKVRFFWTAGFLVFSAGSIVLATLVLWTNGHELAGSVQPALCWETVVWAWLVMLAVTTLHEFAHGLTCKHYGGEVHEIGFLLMYFMPCFYCNVSDAWLFREKSKRLWVTFAGGYFELFLWALAVFVWRLTLPGSFPHYLAFLIVASSGIDTLFNFNPLIKLDGYYLLSDWVEVPNLQQRSTSHFKGHLRRWLWGAGRPASDPRGWLLLGYGVVSWLYSLAFLFFMLWGMFWFFGNKWGVTGMSAVTLLGLVSSRGLLKDTTAGEARRMISTRQKRLVAWLLVLGGLAALLWLVEMNDQASGKFEVRAQTHAELRAAVGGFLTVVNYDEGQTITPESTVARLEIPDLASRIIRKEAEVREAAAQFELLRAGPREVELAQQRRCLAAAQAWRDVAARELEGQRQSLGQDLLRYDKLLDEYRAECDYAQQALARLQTLKATKAVTDDEWLEAKKNHFVCRARWAQTKAERQARAALATLAAQSQLAEREKAVATEEAALALLEAGSRAEQIEAAKAVAVRLREELAFLLETSGRLAIRSPIAGSVTTCRLKEKVGQYIAEGALICEVEDAATLEVVISMDEDQAAKLRSGQRVRLKARSLPFELFEVQVGRIAPRAVAGDVQNTVNVYCRLDDPKGKLRSGMTGHARILCGQGSAASLLTRKFLQFIRTEFWW